MAKSVFIFLLTYSSIGYTSVVPLGITSDQIQAVTEKFTGLMSANASNSPKALGADFEFEITAVYQDLDLNKVNELQPISSEHLLEPIATIRKGLYWNLDLSFSFALPVESQFTSGYSFSLSHSSKAGSFYIKPEVFILNYNVNDVLNLNTSGLSLIFFKKIGAFHLGLGGKLESHKGSYEEKFLGNSTLISTGANEASFVSESAVFKLLFERKTYRFTLTYVFSNKEKSEAAASLGFIL